MNRQHPNNGNLKYGIGIPRKYKEAAQFDKDNRKSLWENEILKELEVLMLTSVFKKIPSSQRKARAKGYQFLPLRIIYYVKVELSIKPRLVIGGHVVNSYGNEVYTSTVKSVSTRILMTITAANDLDVMTDDIGNL